MPPEQPQEPLHAFITVKLTRIDFRLSDGATGSEPIGRPHISHQEREAALARIMKVLLMNKVVSVEIRYDNPPKWD
jgi:hypothetical protein